MNNRDKVIPLKELEVTAIQKKVQLLLDASGAKIVPLKRRAVESTTEAARGIWSGLHADGEDMLTIGEIPHSTLFPRMAAVVHHAGAGTTAACLRAGVPAVPVPIQFDEAFWAARLTALGVRFTQEPTAMGPVTTAVLDDTCGNLIQIAAM